MRCSLSCGFADGTEYFEIFAAAAVMSSVLVQYSQVRYSNDEVTVQPSP